MRNAAWAAADHYVTHYDSYPENEAALKPEQKEALATLRAMIYSRRTGKMGWENGTVGDLFL